MTVLVTGFGPFPGVEDNPTAWLAEQLDGERVGGVPVAARVLPVSFARGPALAAELEVALAPAAVVHLGVSSTARAITVEARAVNRIDARTHDVDGVQPLGACVAPGALDAVLQAPAGRVAGVLAALRGAGVPAERSEDAGRYVCNALYYHSLAAARSPALFVHVPPDGSHDRSGRPWSRSRLLEACRVAVAAWVAG